MLKLRKKVHCSLVNVFFIKQWHASVALKLTIVHFYCANLQDEAEKRAAVAIMSQNRASNSQVAD